MVKTAKLKAAVAYLAERTQPGKVKLFKLLYFADFTAYAKRGQSITGETYENFEMGPVPRTLWRNLEEYASIETTPSGMPIPEQRIHASADADLSVLTQEEKEILNEVIAQYGHLNGARLRDITHGEIPYKVTARGEEIPYYLAPYRKAEKPTQEEVKLLLADPDYVGKIRKILGKDKGMGSSEDTF